MPDDKTKRGRIDRARVSLEQPHETVYWTKRLGVSKRRLIAIVKRVGPMAKDVRRALNQVEPDPE